MQNVSSSNSQAVNVPKLRFPGFEGEWNKGKMESVACYNKKRITVEKNKFVSTENMQQNCAGIEPYNDTTAVEGVKFSENDILIANIRPYLRKAWKVEFNGACSTDVLSITPTEINSDFLFHCIEKEDFFNYVMSAAKGSKMPRGDKQHIMEYTIYFPSEVEQKKVSAFIELLSKRIAKQRKLINAIKLYKRGVSEAIFNKKYKFDCDDSKWNSHTMNDLGSFYNGLSGKGKNDFGKGNAEFITYMNVYKNPISEISMCETVQVSESEKQNKVKYGDVLFSQSSETLDEVGMSSVWLHKTTPYLNSFCFGFRFDNPESIYPLYIAYYMRSHKIRRDIMREGQGATRINLSAERMKGLQLELPTIKIQKKIGDFLYNLDNQILYAETILKRNNELRKSLLQKLFV